MEFNFSFGEFSSRVMIRDELQSIREIPEIAGANNSSAVSNTLLVCDVNTESIAREIAPVEIPFLVLEAGEKSKTWHSVERVLQSAQNAGLGRDGLIIGVGGGTVGDITAFAASVYMRGARLCLISTSLLGMIDASLGGKTGIDLFGLKNLAGTFYPAELVFLPIAALDSLPEREWKSGMAELIKTAVLDSEDFLELVQKLIHLEEKHRSNITYREILKESISRAIAYKGGIVEADPKETGSERALLNLGHSFGHALEATAGLGEISHGEAVAWGMVRACELGAALGITPRERAGKITGLLHDYGFQTRAPHPLVKSPEMLFAAMKGDKKQKAGKLRFIVPGSKSAQIISSEDFPDLEDKKGEDLINNILNGRCPI